jgi:hypothetical protein
MNETPFHRCRNRDCVHKSCWQDETASAIWTAECNHQQTKSDTDFDGEKHLATASGKISSMKRNINTDNLQNSG